MQQDFCPQCGTARTGALRFCRSCAFDFDSLGSADVRQGDPLPEPLAAVTAGTATASVRQSSRRTWIALGSVIFVAIIAAAAFIGLSNSGAFSPKHDIRGTFSLTNTGESFSSSCSGTGGYSDIRTGTNVVLKDGDGKLLATGSLGLGDGSGSTCVFPYALKDVPERPFYTIEVGSRGSLSYSLVEMQSFGWSIDLTLGS